jgi:heme a synthase
MTGEQRLAGALVPESRRRTAVARALARVTVAAVFVLMALGNVVSATGSGLACPDWPLCHGNLVPPLQAHVLLEYSHRLAAVVASGLLVATIVLAVRDSSRPGVRRLGVGLLVLLGVQIALGGVTVLLKLPDLISTAHLVNALLIFGGLLLLIGSGASHPEEAYTSAPSTLARLRRLSTAGLLVLLAQLALGGYVRHSGAGPACPDFPLCVGSIVPFHALGLVHWAHRWLGIALLGFFVHVAVVARRSTLAPIATVLALLAVVQVALGIGAVLLRLDPAARAAHAAVGYALWGVLVWLSVRAGTWRRLLSESWRGRPDLARAAHVV